MRLLLSVGSGMPVDTIETTPASNSEMKSEARIFSVGV